MSMGGGGVIAGVVVTAITHGPAALAVRAEIRSAGRRRGLMLLCA